MRISVLAVLFVLVLTMFLGKPVVHAAEYTSYDTTDIESDLADIDTVLYPKNEKARHRLLDEVGFMEYSYSESVFIADNYYGLYFYVYNPTEKPVSLADGAHHINMATAYDENGEPTDYANCEITFLDATANNRFLKFKLSDSRAAYDTAVEYAAKHDGARRYDIASIQLLFRAIAMQRIVLRALTGRKVFRLLTIVQVIRRVAELTPKRKARLISSIKNLIRLLWIFKVHGIGRT